MSLAYLEMGKQRSRQRWARACSFCTMIKYNFNLTPSSENNQLFHTRWSYYRSEMKGSHSNVQMKANVL